MFNLYVCFRIGLLRFLFTEGCIVTSSSEFISRVLYMQVIIVKTI